MARRAGPSDPFRLIIDRGELNKLLMSESSPIALYIGKKAQRVAASARRRAPKKSGELKAGIGWKISTDEEGIHADIVSPADKFQEKGHIAADGTRVAPRRYLRPALRSIKRG